MSEADVRNVVIIGSGPAGLTAALYAARAELKPLVLAGSNPGGQLMQTTEVENFPGFPEGILGPDLMAKMMEQAKRFGAEVRLESVTAVDFSKEPFTVTSDSGTYRTRSVIIATGAEANWLGLESEQRLRGHGVSACATCDGFFFKGKDVAVIGGGDSAMEEATYLTKFANSVTVVHRREEFKASKVMLRRAQNNPKVRFVTNVEVVEVVGQQAVEGLKVRHKGDGREEVLPVQGVFLAIGHTPTTKLFLSSGVETDERGYVKVYGGTRTNLEGVFVAGDVSDPRYRQAISAAGMGCMAALDVEKYLAEKT